MTSQEVRDPTVEVYFGGEEGGAAVWFLAGGVQIDAANDAIELMLGKPDVEEDLSDPESDIPMVVVSFMDGTSRTWMLGSDSEIDAIDGRIVQILGDPDSVT